MSNLFLRIFLWFWFAMVVITCFVFSEAHYGRPNQTSLDQAVMPLHAQRAAELFETYGVREFPTYFQNLYKPYEGTWYFFDRNGKEMQGKAVPTEVLQLSRIAAGDNQTHIVTIKGHRLVGQRTTGLSGRRYVLVRDLNYPAFAGFLSAARQIEFPQLIVALLCSALVCFWLAYYITAPVRKLRAAANQLASGNLAARVNGSRVKRHDEIAQLGRDFNNMAQRIESLVSSQKRLITDISHELRSPLARLSIALGLARKHANPHTISDLDRIEREAERLNDLIGNLLKLYRLESHAASSAGKEPIALDLLVEEIAADAEYEARGRCSVRITRTEPSSILGVQELVRSAVENIIRNGINYTKQGTAVEISLQIRRPEHVAVIRVRDHGHGVPAEHLEDIFRPFFRVQDARERSSGGTGLGLAITERTVQLHGGQVRAKNAPGGGLVVELWLPATSQDPAARNTNAGETNRADKNSAYQHTVSPSGYETNVYANDRGHFAEQLAADEFYRSALESADESGSLGRKS